MKRNIRVYLGLFLLSLFSLQAIAQTTPTTAMLATTQPTVEHVVWDKTPIAFTVPTGQERMISFPEAVTLSNTNPALTTDKVTILADAGTLYIRAKQAFDPIRVEVKLLSSGQIILLDLSSSTSADDTPIEVVSQRDSHAVQSQRPLLFNGAGDVGNTSTKVADPSSNELQLAQSKPAVNYITLIRFALQQLYAPERLLTQTPAITRVPMYTRKSVILFSGASTNAFPLISWRGGDSYVTAILVKNTLPHRVVLDPRAILGNWQAATFYPSNALQPRGRTGDRTTVIVVSNLPFGQALQAMGVAR